MTNPNDSNAPKDRPTGEIPQDSSSNPNQPPSQDFRTNNSRTNNTPAPIYVQRVPGADKKIAAGICAILLGALGIHKFVLGYNNEGIIMLVITMFGFIASCLVLPILGPFAMEVIGIAEGIIYLTKSDEEFVATYVNGQGPWF